jgi:hypothetical protein
MISVVRKVLLYFTYRNAKLQVITDSPTHGDQLRVSTRMLLLPPPHVSTLLPGECIECPCLPFLNAPTICCRY